MEEGIYYKKGSKSDFAGVDMLPNGNDIERIVIEKIEYHEVLKINGRTENGCWTATFAANPYCQKPMVLNATNKKRIAKMFWNTKVADGTLCEGRINLLKNIAVRLTKEKCRDVSDGGTTEGLRISLIPAAAAPAQKPATAATAATTAAQATKKTITAEQIEKVIEWAKKGGKTYTDVAALYDMSEDIAKQIKEALNG